jgi:pyruvate dehydrogenase E2 component (dihydrolipoamide acetyltransferase)
VPGGRIGEKDVRAAALVVGPTAGMPVPRLVSVGGQDINILTMGDSAGEAAPIVLLHGFGGDLNVWYFNQARLAEDRAVHAIELPAHGRSGLDVGDGSLGALAGAVKAALDALGIGLCHLVGHSLGGAVTRDFALEAPVRVRSLTLIASVGLGPDIEMGFIDGLLAAAGPAAVKAALALLFTDFFTIRRRMVDDMLGQLGKSGVREALRVIADAAFAGGCQVKCFRDRIGDLAMPAQAIWGADDRIVPPTHGDGLGEGIAVHVLEGAGHMPHMERPDEVVALIRLLVRISETGG